MIIWLIPLALALDPGKVKYAVNCGGEEITTFDGVTFLSDKGFSAGTASDYGKNFAIKLTKTPEVYQTERYALEDFSYNVPLDEPGDYVLILKFSEVWFNSEQEKIFNVKIGDITVVEFLDIFSKVGKFAAYDEFVQFKYEGGKVNINNVEAKNAVKNKVLKVDFVKTDFDNPKINGILLYKGKLEETGYYEQKSFLDGLRRSNLQEQAKIEKEFRTDSVYEDENDFEDLSIQPTSIVIEENESLLSILTTVPALVIISLLLVLGVAACLPSKPNAKPQEKSKRN